LTSTLSPSPVTSTAPRLTVLRDTDAPGRRTIVVWQSPDQLNSVQSTVSGVIDRLAGVDSAAAVVFAASACRWAPSWRPSAKAPPRSAAEAAPMRALRMVASCNRVGIRAHA
jgi:hypothetical protein